jgi:predicted esterase
MEKNKLRYNKIIADSYYLKENNKKAIVFCGGFPGSSNSSEVAEKYVQKGFIFVHPKYIGSWESYGLFSIENCKKTIIDFVNALRNKEVKTIFGEKFDLPIEEIFLVGVSFGASVALCAGAELDIKKIVALSPVINYQIQGNGEYNEEKMENTEKFVLAGFENVYRGFREEDLVKGSFVLNADNYFEKLKNKKILLLHGKNDSSVNFHRSEKFYFRLKDLGGDIYYEQTEDNHSSINLNSFEKVSSWLEQ